MKRLFLATLMIVAIGAWAADLRLPDKAVAGQNTTIATTGSGDATLYVVGPGTAIKRDIKLGSDVEIKGEQLRKSGFYEVVVQSSEGNSTKQLYVAPAAPEKVNFLARPSRVPVGQPKVIAGTAFVFDQFENLVLSPTPVTFNLAVPGAAAKTQRMITKDAVAYLQTGSGTKAGPGQLVVSVGDNSVRRVVEQTASAHCNLRFKVHNEHEGLIAETDPVRDCSGNAVPDG